MRLAERPALLVGGADGIAVGAVEAVNVALVGPLALASAYALAARIAGLALGAWTLLAWVALPWLAPLYTLAPYDETVRDHVLPAALGLTSDPGYLEGVAILAGLALVSTRRGPGLVVGGAVLAVVAVVALTRLPLGDLSLDAFQANMAGLREHFWSQRLLQWIPLAGVVAVARRSIPIALALGAWLGAYLVCRAAQPGVGYDEGELLVRLLPALPAYVLLASALPLLVPTLAARLGPLARPAEAP
jgi:hypothetical protein